MEFGKISFNEKIDWSKLTLKEFSEIYSKIIQSGCKESVEEIAKILGIKIPPEKKKDVSPE